MSGRRTVRSTIGHCATSLRIRRRQLLALSVGELVLRSSVRRGASVLWSVGAASWTRPAQADPLTAGIVIATAVAGLVASHNRSDGGSGAMLKASVQYQRVIADQLASVQMGLASVLDAIKDVRKEILLSEHRSRLAQLHSLLGVQVERYSQEVINRGSRFDTYESWLKNENTRSRLQDISNHLDTAAATIRQGRHLDAITALYLPSAAYASLAVRSALGDEPRQLKAEAQRYLDLFDLMEQPDVPGSVAADLEERNNNILQRTSELQRQNFLVPKEDGNAMVRVELGRVAIQDYSPKILISTDDDCYRVPGSDNDVAERCVKVQTYSPERFGDVETFQFFANVRAFEVANRASEDGPLVAIRQFSLEATSLESVKYGPVRKLFRRRPYLGLVMPGTTIPLLPDEEPVLPNVVRVAAATSDERKAAAMRTNEAKGVQQIHASLMESIVHLNRELAYACLDAWALAAVSSTRLQIFRFFDEGG